MCTGRFKHCFTLYKRNHSFLTSLINLADVSTFSSRTSRDLTATITALRIHG